MMSNLSKRLVYACLLSAQLLTYSTAFAKSGGGAIAGGGGDATEERVNEIRADLLKWINKDGAKDLSLPATLSYGEYVSKMTDILQPQEVIIGFVEKDDPTNEELQVSVNGVPKTCRGFISREDSKSHILCNITRFKNTSDSEQYKLVHHEYAGLANVENNDEAASDYTISSQITEYLSMQTVLRLAVKAKPRNENSEPLKIVLTKNKYLGNKKFEVEFSLNHPEDVLQITLNSTKNYHPYPSKIILKNNIFSFSQVVDANEDFYSNDFAYSNVIVQFTDGSVETIPGISYSAPRRFFYNSSDEKPGDIKGVGKYKNLGGALTIVNQEKVHGGYLNLKEYNIKYEISFDVSAVDLSQYIGVIINKGNQSSEEFLSEDPTQIAKFINSVKINHEILYEQATKHISFGCSDIAEIFGICLYRNIKPIDDYYTRSTRDFTIKFITKGDISAYRWSTLSIPNELPKKL